MLEDRIQPEQFFKEGEPINSEGNQADVISFEVAKAVGFGHVNTILVQGGKHVYTARPQVWTDDQYA